MFQQVPQHVPRVSRWRFVRLAAAVVMMAMVGLGPNLAAVDASTTAGGWLTFQNNSGRDVSLVIKYDHPGECGDGYWWVTGSWIIAPGDSARVARLWQGHNPNFYYYAY